MDALEILFTASLWAAAIRIASPLIFATMGELICERAGVLNLGIEGIMTAGAFAGWLTVYAGGDLWPACWSRRWPARRSACCTRCWPCRSACRSMSPASASRCSPPASPIIIYRLALPEVTSPPKIEPFQPLADPRPVAESRSSARRCSRRRR